MSRKSRQKGARKLLRHVLPPWLAVIMLIGCLIMGTICTIIPWISQPTPYEDTIPLSATMDDVVGDWEYHRKPLLGWELNEIRITFSDHEPLYISTNIAHETLLEKLEAFPSGTIFDMRLKPESDSILALSVGEVDVLTYEAARHSLLFNNRLGFLVGLFMLCGAGWSAWSLIMTWRYRRIL